MTTLDPLHVFLSLLCALTALFYLFRLLHKATWIHSGDAENEVGHGVMAVGMLAMLAPAGLLTPDFIYWNILLFALATLWFIGRLFTRKPLLAMVLRTNGTPSARRSDAIHALMHAGIVVCRNSLRILSHKFSCT